MANWLDVGTSCVSNWIAADHIPPGWHLRIVRELEARDLKYEPALFGLDAWTPLPMTESEQSARA